MSVSAVSPGEGRPVILQQSDQQSRSKAPIDTFTVDAVGQFRPSVPREAGAVIRAIDTESLARMILLRRDSALVAIVDPEGRLMWCTRETLAGLGKFGLVAPCGQRLTIPDKDLRAGFEKFVSSGNSDKRMLLRADDGRDWIVIRMETCLIDAQPARILRFVPSAASVDCARNGLAGLFRLTPTETAVLDRYARLCSPEDVAQDMGLSRETVRSHLKRIHAKTGVRSGRELFRLIAAFE